MPAQTIHRPRTIIAHVANVFCALALVLSSSAASAQPAQAGNYIADANNGCKAWNPNPKSTEIIIWSGLCANGLAQGRGKLQWLENNSVYETDEGEWSAGRQFGRGSQVWPLGRYDGEIANSEPNGQGVLTLKTLVTMVNFATESLDRKSVV